MNHKKNQKKPNDVQSFQPSIRTFIIQSTPRKWVGCIYISNFEVTGQIILFLKSLSGEYNGRFLNNPIFVQTAASKSDLELKLTSKLQSLLKNN